MTMRAKLSTACLLLILVNLSVGAFSQMTQSRMAALGFDIYDRAFMAMSYLRASQNGLSRLRAVAARPTQQEPGSRPDANGPTQASAEPGNDTAGAILHDARDDVEVARQRAMSEDGAAATKDIGEKLARLERGLRTSDLASSLAEVDRIQEAFDAAVEIYAGDGYLYRRQMQDLVDRSLRDAGFAIGASALVALVITLVLWGSIMPALRTAVDIARAISAGKLDNTFPRTRTDETGILLRTLAEMQSSLVDKMDRIDALAVEAQVRADELSAQNARFEAALDNMHHGLCMIDGRHRLLVANHRVAEMFGTVPPLGTALEQWPGLRKLAGALLDGAPATEEMADGRIIRIASRPVRHDGWVVTFEDVTERHRTEAKLFRMARYDALTDLPNRVLFRESLEAHVRSAGPTAGPTVLFLDLDGFKAVNDTLGHAVGDALLHGVAKRMKDCLEPFEMMARLGGDEFAVMLRSPDHAVAERRARDLIEALRPPFDVAQHRVAVGASIGIASPACGATADTADLCTTLLKNADVALYRAKAEGKGTYRFHSDALDAALVEHRELEAALRSALERGELTLAFQPIVAASDARVKCFEALIRWTHPERGAIPPTTFIPIAEKTGLITAIGLWVLQTACREASRWPEDIGVAVNLSPVQFRQGFIVDDVTRALADTGLAPRRLELEITESVLIQDSEPVVDTLTQLRQLGVRIALDDFGTGYSSLSYLRKFPFDKLKIDRSFVQNLSDRNGLSILKAMIGLGRALNVAVLAEGVETAEQAERLRLEGCSEFQGYHFGQPQPAQSVPRVIDRLSTRDAAASRAYG